MEFVFWAEHHRGLGLKTQPKLPKTLRKSVHYAGQEAGTQKAPTVKLAIRALGENDLQISVARSLNCPREAGLSADLNVEVSMKTNKNPTLTTFAFVAFLATAAAASAQVTGAVNSATNAATNAAVNSNLRTATGAPVVNTPAVSAPTTATGAATGAAVINTP